MRTRKIWKLVGGTVLSLLAATIACSGGVTTTRQSLGNSGYIEIKTDSADGSSSQAVEIDEDQPLRTVLLDITLQVSAGRYRAEFRDANGKSLVLEASAGSPASGSVEMETDFDGEITLEASASNAEDLVITIDYTFP
jgi:hypothetical protein